MTTKVKSFKIHHNGNNERTEVEMDRLLTLKEVAEITGKAVRTLYNAKSTGRYPLKFIKLGRSVRVKESDLNAWIDRV